jgi:acyl-CoA synthetase (AMP-forming)/AMP-acid ligase II/acyl carrier protein
MNIQDAINRLRRSTATLTFLEADGKTSVITYEALYENALFLLGAIQERGFALRRMAIELSGVQNRVTALWACWLGNIAPIQGQPAEEREKADKGSRAIILTDGTKEPLSSAIPDVLDNRGTIFYQDLKSRRAGTICAMADADIALLQYTSGSASSPRKAVLTGANLWEGAQVSAVVARDGVRERYLSWLPLSHIFGLVGYHLVPLWREYDQFLIDTGLFLKKPSIWLEKCSEWSCTLTGTTPFGLDLAKKNLSGQFDFHDGTPLDLGGINVCLCGGENLDAGTLFDFEKAAAPYGWRHGVLCPAYGLSETTMGVSYKPPGEEIRVDRIKPESVAIGGKLAFDEDAERFAIERVSLGVLDQCNEVMICDLEGHALPDGHLGVIRVRGSNVCAGYEPQAFPPNPDAGGWLDTGDLGYFRDGRLSLFARLKEVICRNGLNYVLPDIEKSASQASGGINLALAETSSGAVLFAADGSNEALSTAAKAVSEKWRLPVAAIARVEELPRLSKGAIDRLSLTVGWESGLYGKSAIFPNRSSGSSVNDGKRETLNEIEADVARIWSEILEVPHDSISRDSRFTELGGDSLFLFDLAAAIERDFGVYAETADLAKAPALAECALLIKRLQDKN